MNFPPDSFPTRPCRAVTTEPRYFSCQNKIQRWAIPVSFPLWSFDVMSVQPLRNFISQSLKNPLAQLTAIVEVVSPQAPSLVPQPAEVSFPGLPAASMGQSGAGNHFIFTKRFPLLHHAFPFLSEVLKVDRRAQVDGCPPADPCTQGSVSPPMQAGRQAGRQAAERGSGLRAGCGECWILLFHSPSHSLFSVECAEEAVSAQCTEVQCIKAITC